MGVRRRSRIVRVALLLCAMLSTALADVTLNSTVTNKLFSRMAMNSSDTWVSGTRAQAIIEFKYPSLSVFSTTYYPLQIPATVPTLTNAIIQSWWARRPPSATQFAVVDGGAAADPASLGVAWTLAQLSATSPMNASYKVALEQEIAYLLSVKRSADGAMSMRQSPEPVQLWADFVYMVPPYLAFYGVVTNNGSLVQLAFDQLRLYRTALLDPSTGLWQHIVLGSWQDYGIWGTGNAWAAAGMIRVLATIQNSPLASKFTAQTALLSTWINSILTLSFSKLGTDNLLPNYYGVPISSTFSDTASSALLAACAYRMDTLKRSTSRVNSGKAELIRAAVYKKVNPSTGWVDSVVDPLSWQVQINQSPESVAFVVLMQAAWRDWKLMPNPKAS